MSLPNYTENAQSISMITAAVNTYNTEQAAFLMASKNVESAIAEEALRTMGLGNEQASLAYAFAQNTVAQEANAGISLKISNVYKGLASSTGLTTGALYGMTAALAGIAVGIVIYQQIKKHQEEMYQALLDSARAAKEAREQIDQYADTYSKLQKELNEANTSEERQYEIKKELLAIQTELNSKYGEEHGKLNLITGSYKEQANAIKELNKELSENWLNENANKKSFKDAEKAMTKKSNYVFTSVEGLYDFGSNGKILEIARKLESDGHEISIEGVAGSKAFSIKLEADVTDANNTINTFMNEIKKISGYQDDLVLTDFNDGLSSHLLSANKIIGNNQELYDQILEHKILANDELSSGFSKAKASVNEYNEALLSGDTSRIDEANKAIKKVQASIDTNSDLWSPYKYKISDIFSQANTNRNDFKNSISIDDHFTGTVFPQIRGKTSSQLIYTNEFKELIKEADKYKLSTEDVISVLREMGIVKKDIAKIKDESYDPRSLKSQVVLLEEISGKFLELDKLQAEFNESGSEGITNETMAAFAKTFEGLDDSSFDQFFSVLKDASATEHDIQNAFNNFASDYVYSTDCLKGLTEATAEQTIKELELAGVQNASAIVMNGLAFQKAEAVWQSQDLTNATISEISQLATEAGVAGESANAFLLYVAQKMLAEDALDPSGDITALQNIVTHLGFAGSAWRNYYLARAKLQEVQESSQTYFLGDDGKYHSKNETISGLEAKMADEQKKLNEEMNNSKIEVDFKGGYIPTKTKSTSSDKNSGTAPGRSSDSVANSQKKANEEQREHFNWLERKLAVIENRYKDINSLVKDETKSYYVQDAAIVNLIALNEKKKKVLESQKVLNQTDLDTALEVITDEKLKSSNFDISKADLEIKITQGGLDTNKFVLEENSSDEQKRAFDDLIKNIKEAMSAQDDLQKTEDALEDTEEDTRRLQKERFEKRIAEIKAENDALKNQQSTLQAEISLLESLGGVVTADMYQEMIDLSQQQEEMYAREAEAARDRMYEVENGSAEYYQLMAQVQECETSIIDCKTAQAKWNEEIKRIPVKKLQRYLEILNHAKEDLQNFIDEQAALGIDTNKDQYQQLINISNEQIDKLLEQQTLLKDILKDYQFNSDKYNETASEIQNIDNEISSLIQSQHEWNQAILQIPINKLTETSDAMQAVAGAMGDILSTYDTAISSAVSVIDDEIDAVNDLRDASSKEYEERIRQYQDQLDLLQKQNDERQIQLQLEQAQYDLERARSQKTIATIRNGEMVYEADSNALRSANEALKDVEYNKVVHDLEKQITSLEEERDTLLESYDEQIERLDTIKEKWSGLTEEIQKAADAVKATEIFGEGWQDQILSGNDSAMFESMKNMYSSIHQQQQQYQDQIASNERIAEMMNLFMEKFRDGSLTYEQAMSGIDHLIRSMADGFTSFDHLDALLGINNASGLSALLSSMESSANASVNQFSDYMSIIKANGKAIDKYTSTWTEMQKSIQDQMGELKNLYGEAPTNRSSYTDRSVFDDFDTEDVFHPKQISQFISDIGQLADAKNYINQLHALGSASLPLPQTTERNYGSDVTINMGNIELPDVRDIDGFARAIGSQFKSLMRQEMTK